MAQRNPVGSNSNLHLTHTGHGGTDWHVGHDRSSAAELSSVSSFDEVDVSIGPAGDLAFGTTPNVRVDAHGRDRNVLKGAVAGAIGGIVGSFVMTQFSTLWTKMAEGHESQSSGGEHDARDWQERSEDQNATELVADTIAEKTIDRPLSRDEMAVAAPVVHYAFGTSAAAVYGAAAETMPSANPLAGAAFGTAVWIGADNIGVPLLRLSGGPQNYTPEMYAQGLAAHIVYGVTTDIVRRLVRAAI